MNRRTLPRAGTLHIAGRLIFYVVIAFVGVAPASAQLTTATISGTVTDESSAIMPGVTVGIKNTNTGIERTQVTNERGRYEATNLALGPYEVTATLQGFNTSVRRGITLTAGRNAVVDHVLKIGGLEEQLVVTGDAPLLETTSATVSTLINSRKVEDLPLVNRDLTQLTFMQPGVVKIPSSGTQGVFSGMGDKFTVAGARGSQNLYLLDGVSNSDLSGNPQGASGSYAGAETVQEIQIVTNNYSAEYRSAAGGIVSAVTKSGTNNLHGSAYVFHRDDRLESLDYFQRQNNLTKPEFNRNQWGGSMGGPVVRNRMFFFGSYEGLKEGTGTTDIETTLTAAARQGLLPSGRVAVSPKMAPYLALYPVPGQGNTVMQDLGNGTVRVASTGTSRVQDNFVLGKLDTQLRQNHNLSVTYNWDSGSRHPYGMLTEVGDTNIFGTESRRKILGIKHTAVLGATSLNEFHFGVADTSSKGDVPLTSTDFSNIAFRPGTSLVGQLNVSGLAAVGFRVNYSEYRQRGYTFKDSFSSVRGNHSLRLGGEVSYYQYDVNACSRGCNGVWAFPSVSAFLQANPSDFQITLPGSDQDRNLVQTVTGSYFQDNWKLKPNFTLNLGLRYEFATVPNELNDKQGALIDPLNPAPTNYGVTIGPFFKNPTKKSFSPRLGFAWAPGKENRWSVRGGIGVFYEHPMLYNIRTTLQELPPFTLVGRLRQGTSRGRVPVIDFPNAYQTQLALLSGTPNIRTMDYNMKPTTIYRWSTTVQRDLGHGFVTSIDYTGSRGYNLWQQTLTNLNRWQGYPDPVPSLEKYFPPASTPIFPQFGEMRIQYSNAGLWYKGVSVGLQKRMDKGFSMQTAFTLSKAVDQGSGVTSAGDELPQSQRGIYTYDMDLKKGPSAYDIRKAFSTSLSYEVPSQATGLAGALAKGWQLNSVITVTDGYPVSVGDSNEAQNSRIGSNEDLRPNVVSGGDPRKILGGPDQYYDVSQFTKSTLGYFGNVPRGTIITPGLVKIDLSIFKNFQFTATQKVQFRFEIFNLLNRANFGTPEMSVILPDGTVNPEAGSITKLRTPGREAQIGLRWVF